MSDQSPFANISGSRLLTAGLALALVLVACGIGSVAWHCIDSLHKNSDKVKSMNGPAKEVPSDFAYQGLSRDMDQHIYQEKIDPMVAFQMQPPQGSEIPFNKAMEKISNNQYREAAEDLCNAIVMFRVEANTRHTWHVGENSVDKRIYLASLLEQRARCYMECHNFKPALVDLSAAISLRPEYANNYKNRAKVYELIGDKAKSEADIKLMHAVEKKH